MNIKLIKETNRTILDRGIKYRLQAEDVQDSDLHALQVLAAQVAHRLSQRVSFWDGDRLSWAGVPVKIIHRGFPEVAGLHANFLRFGMMANPDRLATEAGSSKFSVIRLDGEVLDEAPVLSLCRDWINHNATYEEWADLSPEISLRIEDPLGLLAAA
jgi:hypothetical protein